MTTLTMRYIEGDFVVTGPDVEPARFAGRPRTGAWHTTRAAHQRDRSDLQATPQRGATSGEERPQS
jgi:hypothetical protein